MESTRIRFELFINGEKKTIAGIGSHGVLVASLTWSGNAQIEVTPQMTADPDFNEQEWLSDHIDVRLGGLDSETEEHLLWFKQDLLPGDEVTFRVLPAGEYDVPIKRHLRQPRREDSAEAEPPSA